MVRDYLVFGRLVISARIESGCPIIANIVIASPEFITYQRGQTECQTVHNFNQPVSVPIYAIQNTGYALFFQD